VAISLKANYTDRSAVVADEISADICCVVLSAKRIPTAIYLGFLRKMSSSGTLRRVTLVRTDISEEPSTSIIRVTRIGELGTLAVTSNRRMLRRNTVAACVGC
jgi:hypothetical protein